MNTVGEVCDIRGHKRLEKVRGLFMTEKPKSRLEHRKLEHSSKTKRKKIKYTGRLKKILLVMTIIGITGLLFGTSVFAYYVSTAPKLVDDQLKDPISSEIYDMNGKLVTKIGVEKRDYVEYKDIPQLVIDAVLATEDNRFFSHPGLDVIRIGGAVVANLTDGFGSQGGSTLTQQIIKCQFLTPDKTPKRKVQEAWLALQLERKYTKEEIFEMYVNNIVDYDDGIHGIATAAEYYYGKSLDQLELHEAAMLAGIPQRPRAHNPYRNPDLAKQRRNTVLSLMYQHGKISKAEMETAKKISVESTLKKDEERTANNQKYDSFIDVVIDEVEALGEYNVFTDGLKIYTTLDPNAQEHVEKILNGEASVKFPDEEMQAGLTLLDTKSGAIRAIGGGRNQNVKRGFNYAIDTRRQPGSTIKPILDYGPAIEFLGWSPYEQLADEPFTYSDGTAIHNWDQKYLGQMSMRKALYLSRNIPALKALQEVGLDKADQFATGLGFNFKNIYESYAIGGLGGEDSGVSPLQMASAYAAFGNEGIYNKPYAVNKIILRDGDTEVKGQMESHLAMKKSTAFLITDMLKDVLTKGTGTNARVSGLPYIAGKTGTTNYSQETRQKYSLNRSDVPDAWFVGYSTQYTISVWTGYKNQTTPIKSQHQKIAQQLFRDLMGHISKSIETPNFKQPKNVVQAAVEVGTKPAMLPSETTPQDQIVHELFVRGTEPKSVSKKYAKLEAPKNLKTTVSGDGPFTLSWEYSNFTGVQFEVSEINDFGEKEILYTGTDHNVTIDQPLLQSDRTFQVAALSENRRSEAVQIFVPGRTDNLNNTGLDEDDQEQSNHIDEEKKVNN